MAYFPFMVDVRSLTGLIVGGGRVALEKVEQLLTFDGKIKLVSLEICDEIREKTDRLELYEMPYSPLVLEGVDYVVAATNDIELNKEIYLDARKKKLLVNVVDMPQYCDFIFPSVLKRGKLVVGVSTSGAGPRVATHIRKDIEAIIPSGIEEILDYLAEERVRAKEEIPDSALRRKYLIELADKLLNEKEK